jgi:riboflavin-specific deaminase-like protein
MSNPTSEQQPLIRQLVQPGAPTTVREIVQALDLPAQLSADGPARPYLLLNMVSTVDGRATIGGRSGPIGNRADRELFHGLRGAVDAVLIGAGTASAERYHRLIREEASRELRRTRGLTPEPLACIVSGRLSLPADIPLLTEPGARVVILTASQASLPDPGADIQYIRCGRDGRVDLPAALSELRERFGVRTTLCEGGPHLNAQLLRARLVDELFLSFAPKLAGGGAAAEVLRILAGAELDPPIELQLRSVLESDSHLFLRYGVGSSAAEPAG